MGMASLESQPEFAGNYSWFSYQGGEQLIERKPFHMNLLKKKEIDEVIKLLQPKHVITTEGKTIYFPFLYEKQMG